MWGGAIVMLTGGDPAWWPRPEKGEKVAPGAPEFVGRPVAAVSMSTGQISGDVPDPHRSFSIPFDWQYRDEVKPQRAPYQPQAGDDEHFAGISANGVPYPMEMDFKAYAQHAAMQADGNWAVFSLRPEGATRPSTLWWARLGRNEQPQLLAEDQDHQRGRRGSSQIPSDDGERRRSLGRRKSPVPDAADLVWTPPRSAAIER